MKLIQSIFATAAAVPVTFFVFNTQAQTVAIPNVFQSGTPAIAADVNENFNTLRDALNAQIDATCELYAKLAPDMNPSYCPPVIIFESCNDIYLADPSSASGTYSITPELDTYQVYCSMEGDGGWTLVVGINSTNRNHMTSSEVSPWNIASISGEGKFSDDVIKSLATTEYRLECGSSVNTFSGSCDFDADALPVGECTKWDDAWHQHWGLEDKLSEDPTQHTIYANSVPELNLMGCAVEAWGYAGKLWVR